MTFLQAGDFLINLDSIAYIDLSPEPGVQVIHVYFNTHETEPDGSIAPHFVELADQVAVSFLAGVRQISNVNLSVDWLDQAGQRE